MRLIKAILFGLFWVCIAHAKTIYVSQNTNGTGDGTTLPNCQSIAWAGTSGSWGVGANQIGSGDTLNLNGTLTSELFLKAGNVTIVFATGAKFSAPVWTSTYGAIYVPANCDNVMIDGGTNGIIENTANGTLLANQLSSVGIKMQSCKFFTVKNLTVRNIYVRTSTTDLSSGSGDNVAISMEDTGAGMTNLLVTNCIISDTFCGINSDYGPGCANYDFSYNTIFNINWGGRCGDRGATSTLMGLIFHHNRIYNWANWNDTTANNFHHNGFYAWAENGGIMTNPKFYNNIMGPGWGGSYQTAGVYASNRIDGCQFYNNIFYADPGEGTGNGFITPGCSIPGAVVSIYNNTFYGGSCALWMAGGNTQTITVKNNLAYNYSTGCFMYLHDHTTDTFVCNNNLGYGISSTQGYSIDSGPVFNYKTFAQWKALGYDTTPGVATDPLLNGLYAPALGSPVIGAGADLSGTFTTDYYGALRTVPWTIGAALSGAISGTPRFPLFQRQSRGYIPR